MDGHRDNQNEKAGGGNALSLHNLSRHYGDIVAVNNISADIANGRFVALVGASGSGKSTLLKMINRLIVPSVGQIIWHGQDVADISPHILRRSIGYVFQHIGLFPHMTIAQNIGISAKVAGDPPLAQERIAELLALVDLPRDFAARMPDELSGGQQQRVGVARALAGEGKTMLMDEPFGALDPITREQLADEYRALHDRLGLTTIMVTHDMSEALLMADDIWVMDKGQIVDMASPVALLNGRCSDVAKALVKVPKTQAERLVRMENDGEGAI